MNIFKKIALGLSVIAMPVAAIAGGNSGDGRNRWVNVENNSDYEVFSVYYGVPGRAYYSRDLLGSYTLDPDYNIDINIDDGSGRCVFNLQARTRSGETTWTKQVNVCSESSWTLVN